MFDDVTHSAVTSFSHILVVHDRSYDLEECYAALRKRFIVRTAMTIAEAAEIVRTLDIRCVVGVVGGSIRARALIDAFGSGDKLGLLRTTETSVDDDLFLLTEKPKFPLLSPVADDLVAGVGQIVGR